MSVRTALRSPWPWLALVIPIAITIGGWQLLWREASSHAAHDFGRRVETAGAALRARMAVSEQALIAGAAFIGAAKDVNRAQWADFVARLKLDEKYPGLTAMGFAERVRGAERERHVKRIQADGLPEYDIRPAGARDDYVVIVYNEPHHGRNARMVGLDTYSQPILRAAILRAFEGGGAAISERALLPDDDGRTQTGFVMYVPAFRPGMPLSTPAERDAALMGFVFGTFRAKELVTGLFDAGLAQDVNMALYDGAQPSPEVLLADTRADGAGSPASVFKRNSAIDVGGRKWTAVISSDPRFDTQAAEAISIGILVVGLLMSAALFQLALQVVSARQGVAESAIRDPLTQMFNARYLEAAMRQELQRAKRSGQTVGFVMLDIDNFKKIGETYGPECGEQVLKQFSLLMEKNTRDSDIKCRLGGSEFAIGMPGASLENARMRAERLREVLESLALECRGQAIGTVTLSAGAAAYPLHGDDWGSLQRKAHRALYAAKEAGRNRVALAE